MGSEKCKICDQMVNVVNKKSGNRAGTKCSECQGVFCHCCAELSAEFCDMMKNMGQFLWKCGECKTKAADMKMVLQSMKAIQSEIGTLKKGQEDQQVEREQVLEGLKVVEAVAKRVEKIENTQAEHGERLATHEIAIKRNTKKIDDGMKKINEMEEGFNKIEKNTSNVRQTNAVVREIREIEKREKNIIICNIPESSSEDTDERKKEDEGKVGEIFRELKVEQVRPINIIRVGVKGRYPRKVLVILRTLDECERIFYTPFVMN